ncbi:MAG: N-acetylmuramoyl-L-alanine amidase [Firmicutes bacterium]|nr:N-acetylmuramoyl-L-alanine amidase [Bacillota bacterium]
MLHAISDAAVNPGSPYEIGRIRDIFDDYGVEAHYVIDREGTIYQFVQDDRIARHAGAGSWQGNPRLSDAMNRYAIGIELLGIGTRGEMKGVIGSLANTLVKADDRGYTDAQYLALKQLLAQLTRDYSISRENIISHQAYDPARKWDPGQLFDWSRIAF